MCGLCDAGPTVTSSAAGHHCWYHIMLNILTVMNIIVGNYRIHCLEFMSIG